MADRQIEKPPAIYSPFALKQEALQSLYDTLSAYKAKIESLENSKDELRKEIGKEICSISLEDPSKIQTKLEGKILKEEQFSQSSPKCTTEKVDLCRECLRQEKTC